MANEEFDQMLEKAEDFAQNGQWQEAYDILCQASAMQPGHVGALTGMGTSLLQLNRARDAVNVFEQALLISVTSPDAHNNLGVAFALSGQLDRAETEYLKAIEIDTGHMAAWKNLAQVYIQQKDRIGEGIKILAGVINTNPRDCEALILLGICYEAGGEYVSARDMANAVLHLEPDNIDAQNLITRLVEKDKAQVVRPEQVKKLSSLKNLPKKPTH
jgi:Flp pilus assembly protein TadD